MVAGHRRCVAVLCHAKLWVMQFARARTARGEVALKCVDLAVFDADPCEARCPLGAGLTLIAGLTLTVAAIATAEEWDRALAINTRDRLAEVSAAAAKPWRAVVVL